MPVVTVATLNLFHNIGRWEERLPLLLDQFIELRPDVIGLQEVNLATDQGMLLAGLINERLAGDRLYDIYHMARPGKSAHVQAQAVMSRLPAEAHEGLDYLLYEGVAQRLRLRLDGGAHLDFYNTHLHYPPDAREARVAQAERLLAWAEASRGAPTVIAGDFNAYPGEPVLALMKGRFQSAHEAVHGREPEKTWPTPVNTWDPSPAGCLDYIFVDGARALDAALAFDRASPQDPTLFPSDHLGVTARIEVP